MSARCNTPRPPPPPPQVSAPPLARQGRAPWDDNEGQCPPCARRHQASQAACLMHARMHACCGHLPRQLPAAPRRMGVGAQGAAANTVALCRTAAALSHRRNAASLERSAGGTGSPAALSGTVPETVPMHWRCSVRESAACLPRTLATRRLACSARFRTATHGRRTHGRRTWGETLEADRLSQARWGARGAGICSSTSSSAMSVRV